MRRKRRTKNKLRLKAVGIDRSKFLSRTELYKQLGISAPTVRRRAEIDPIFPKAVKPLKGLTLTLYSASDVKEYARVLSMEPNRNRWYTPLALKLKAAGIDRSKFLSGRELYKWLNVTAPTLYRWMKIDPAFPRALRPFKQKKSITLFSVEDVEEYERVLAARREDLIKRVECAIESDLHGGKELSISNVAAATRRVIEDARRKKRDEDARRKK